MRNSICKLDDANASIETIVPAEIRDILGKPPLLATEDPNAYYTLLAKLAREEKPSGIVEWLWVKDIADHTWDIIRLRRIKAAHVNGQFKSVVARQLQPIAERERKPQRSRMAYMAYLEAIREAPALALEEANRLVNDYFSDAKATEKVDTTLKAQGLDADTMIAGAFVGGIGHMEALDRMTASAEARRMIALREIERRRFALGRALRQTSDEVIEVDAPTLVPLAVK